MQEHVACLCGCKERTYAGPSYGVSLFKDAPTPLRPAGADAQHQPEQCGEGRWQGGARGREGGAAAQQQRRACAAAAGAWECMMATL